MSRTLEFACHDCRVTFWAGQHSHSRQKYWLYVGTPEYIEALNEFLNAHLGHRLVVDDSERIGILDYEESPQETARDAHLDE